MAHSITIEEVYMDMQHEPELSLDAACLERPMPFLQDSLTSPSPRGSIPLITRKPAMHRIICSQCKAPSAHRMTCQHNMCASCAKMYLLHGIATRRWTNDPLRCPAADCVDGVLPLQLVEKSELCDGMRVKLEDMQIRRMIAENSATTSCRKCNEKPLDDPLSFCVHFDIDAQSRASNVVISRVWNQTEIARSSDVIPLIDVGDSWRWERCAEKHISKECRGYFDTSEDAQSNHAFDVLTACSSLLHFGSKYATFPLSLSKDH